MNAKKRVLVVCTGNSCRSQMAEGWIRHKLGDFWEVCSAGTSPAAHVHPLAIRAMAEAGIDISGAMPKPVDRYLDQDWDLVVAVCDAAHDVCPVFHKQGERLHSSFPDPARAQGSEEERMAVFRSVRDAIRDKLLPEIEHRG